jgi:hypothetical protein
MLRRVALVRTDVSEELSAITLGNHQCNGAGPIFRSRRITTAYEWISLRLWVRFTRAFMITRNIRVDEARAWMRKYFSDASVV